MTAASTLYEAVEPQILWQQLYATARAELFEAPPHPKVRMCNYARTRAHITQALGMIRFILSTFKTHDAEVQSIHLPVVSTALAELCKVCIRQNLCGLF